MMTEKGIMMNKKQNVMDKDDVIRKRKEGKDRRKKMKQMKKKRLIVRNLSFKVTEEKLKEIFSEFGEVVETKIPVTEDGRKRGFAFIQYKDTKSQVKAMKSLNFKKIDGRPIAVDFAVDKNTYQSRLQNQKSSSSQRTTQSEDSESEDDVEPVLKRKPQSDASDEENDNESDEENDNESDEDKKVKSFLKEFDADVDDDDNMDDSSNDSSEEEEIDDETESHHSDETANTNDASGKKWQSQDVAEGKTIFIRNISFKNSEDDLQEIMQEYGKTEYCLLCVDPLTDHPKGTAFVKFKEKESADKLLEESSKEPGVLLDGRRLLCSHAVSREDISKIYNQPTKVKDKRNMRLLKCGLIMKDSKEAEGVSQTDLAKRAQLEIVKKQKLKNVNFFVSDKRLAVHNLPKNMTDKDLLLLFKRAAGKEASIKEARVMRDFKKTNAQGIPVSRGFGFVSFTEHDHALKALIELNNNPNIFTPQKRPIVEFSVENKVALLSQERRREKIMMRNKKRMEEKIANNDNQSAIDQQVQFSQKIAPRKNIKRKNKGHNSPIKRIEQNSSETHSFEKKKGNKSKKNQIKRKNEDSNSPNKKMKQNPSDVHSPEKSERNKSKKKQKKRYRNKNKKGPMMNNQDNDSLSHLTNKYKEKLLNKFS